MTVAELYNDAWGTPATPQPGFYGLTEDNWRRDPAHNPMLLPADDDARLIAYEKQVNDLSSKLLKKNKARQLQSQAQLLKSLVEQPSVNLFDKPTNPTEQAAQKLVQDNIDAGVRGWAYGRAGEANNRKLANEALDRTMRIRDQRMQEASYRRGVARDNQLFPLQLEGERARLEASKAQSRDRVDDNQRQRMQFEALRNDNDFKTALSLVEDGSVNPSQLMQAFPRLNPNQLAVLDAAAKSLAQGDQSAYDEIRNQADVYTNNLKKQIEDDRAAYVKRNTGRFWGTPSEEGIAQAEKTARDAFLNQTRRDKGATGLRFNEDTGSFEPIMAPPRPYDPLDRAMGARGYTRPPAAAAMPADGIPVVVNPQDLDRYSDYKVIRDPSGKVRLNPRYRPAMAVTQGGSVQSRSLPNAAQDPYYYGWR